MRRYITKQETIDLLNECLKIKDTSVHTNLLWIISLIKENHFKVYEGCFFVDFYILNLYKDENETVYYSLAIFEAAVITAIFSELPEMGAIIL